MIIFFTSVSFLAALASGGMISWIPVFCLVASGITIIQYIHMNDIISNKAECVGSYPEIELVELSDSKEN
jgi:hypothetical protein